MRALPTSALFSLVLFVPLLCMHGCHDKDENNTPGSPSASVSGSSSGSGSTSAYPVSSAPHTYGDVTDAEITDALKRKRVIAILRPRTVTHQDVGSKGESVRYEIELVKPLNGSMPTETIHHGSDEQMIVGRLYAVVVDRMFMRELVSAVEVPEDKLRDVSKSIEDRIAAIAPMVAASASADDADDDAGPPSASGSASASASASPSASASGKSSANAKPSAGAIVKPAASSGGASAKPT